MTIGTVWADNTWDDDAWADNTWADAETANTGKGWPKEAQGKPRRKRRREYEAEARQRELEAPEPVPERYTGISAEVARAAAKAAESPAKPKATITLPAAAKQVVPDPAIIARIVEAFDRLAAQNAAELEMQAAILKARRQDEFMIVAMMAALA